MDKRSTERHKLHDPHGLENRGITSALQPGLFLHNCRCGYSGWLEVEEKMVKNITWTSCEDHLVSHEAHELEPGVMCIGVGESMEQRIARIQTDHNISEATAKYVAEAEIRMEEKKRILG